MRAVVFGVGAIGGVVAAALARTGHEVIGIARGGMLDALRSGGLRLRSPDLDEVVSVPVVASADEIDWRPDDAVLLCMKTQHTLAALEALRAAGVSEHPIFCLQNGVSNERTVLRFFPNVHGVNVMLPATYLTPGEVIVYSQPQFGVFDIGRYPIGAKPCDDELAEMLNESNIAAYVRDDVMRSKRGKLLLNLGNVVEAALGPDADDGGLRRRLRDEAKAVFAAHEIAWEDVGEDNERRKKHMNMTDVPGLPRVGGSTTQSLLRGTGNVETDYLNGEIVFLGRLAGVATPANAYMTTLAARMVREGLAPGSVSVDEIKAALDRG